MTPGETFVHWVLWIISSWEGIAGLSLATVSFGTGLLALARRHFRSVANGFKELRNISLEFRTNGGSSFLDRINLLCDTIASVSEQLNRVESNVVTHSGVVQHLCCELRMAVLRTDVHGNCQWVSPAWCTVSGMAYADAIGQGWRSAVDPRDRYRVDTEWDRCIEEACVFRSEFRFLRPDNYSVWVSCHATVVRDHLGRMYGMTATFRELHRPIEQYSHPA